MSRSRSRRNRFSSAAGAAILFACASLFAEPMDVLDTAGPVPGEGQRQGSTAVAPSSGKGTVSTKTGAFQYSIPIDVPPGRAGMEPELALRYASDQPTYGSVVGAGWELSVPVIERDWSLGQGAPTRWKSGLAGGRELVETSEPEPSSTWKTFRAQSDPSFARYQFSGNTLVPGLWRVLTRDGKTYYFNEPEYISGSPYAPFRDWMPLTRVVDAFGNEVRYHWVPEEEVVPIGLRLHQIDYTINDGAGIQAHAQIVFTYETGARCTPQAIPVGSRLSYRGGTRRVFGLSRLNKITTRVQSGSGLRTAREYQLAYSTEAEACDQSGGRSPMRLLESVVVKATSPEGVVTTQPPVTFSYAGSPGSSTVGDVVGLPLRPVGNDLLPEGRRAFPPEGGHATDQIILDINGDGRPDYLWASYTPSPHGGTSCAIEWHENLGINAAGDYAFGPAQTIRLPTWPWRNWSAGNELSPGTPDLGQEFCSLSGQFSMYANPGYPTAGYPGAYLMYHFADLTRDGIVDLSVGLSGIEEALEGPLWQPGPDSHDPSIPERQPFRRWYIYTNLLAGAERDQTDMVWDAPFPVASDAQEARLIGGYEVRSDPHAIADMDGDGYPDFVVVVVVSSVIYWHIYPTGGGTPYTWDWSPGSVRSYPRETVDRPASQFPDYYSTTLAALWDMNADGLPDLYRRNPPDGDLEILYNTGSGFSHPRTVQVIDGLEPPAYLTETLVDVGSSGNALRADTIQAYDAHRDGRRDFYLSTQGHRWVNLGDGFLTGRPICDPFCFPNPPSPTTLISDDAWRSVLDFIDVDGDGFLDSINEPSVGYLPTVRNSLPSAPPAYLVSIDNGRGMTTAIEYSPLGDGQVVNMGDGTHPDSRWVVESKTAIHEFGGTPPATTSYFYDTPVRTADDRGLLGFRGFQSVTETGPSGASEVSRYDYSVDWSGRISSSLVFQAGSSTPSSIVDTSWQEESLSLGSAAPVTFFHARRASYQCEYLDASGASASYDEAACRAQVNPRVSFTELVPIIEGTQIIARVPAWTFDAEELSATELDGFFTLAEYAHINTPFQYRIVSTRSETRAGTATGGQGAWQIPATQTAVVERAFDSTLTFLERSCTARDPAELDLQGRVDPSLGVCTAFDYDTQTGQVLSTMKPEQYYRDVIVGGAEPFDPGTAYTEIEFSDPSLDPLSVYKVYPVRKRNELGHEITSRTDLATGVVLETAGPNSGEGQRVVIDGFGRTQETWVSSTQTWDDPADPVNWIRTAIFTYVDAPSGGESPKVVAQLARDDLVTNSAPPYGWVELRTFVDGAGRPIKEVEWDLAEAQVRRENTWAYDASGNMIRATGPDPSQDSVTATVDHSFEYDSLGRRTCSLAPDGSGTVAIYAGRTLATMEIVPDSAGGGTCAVPASSSLDPMAAKTVTSDVFGRVIEVREKVDASTEAETLYDYDAAGNLAQIRRVGESPADDVVTAMTHDWIGNRIGLERHSRTWTYSYDRNGNLLAAVAPVPDGSLHADYVTSYLYDDLDREIERLEPAADLSASELQELAVGTTTFHYDQGQYGIGRMTGSSFPFGSVALTYDARGNVASRTHSFDLSGPLGLAFPLADSKTEYYTWNAMGQLRAVLPELNAFSAGSIHFGFERFPSVPSGFSVVGIEDGSLLHLTTVELERNAAGLVRRAQHATSSTGTVWGRTVDWTRDELGRVLGETSSGTAAEQIVQSYTYGGTHEVQAMTSHVGSIVAPRSFTFDYDDRHQLTNADDDIDYSAAFAYTRTGKLASAFVQAPTGAGTLTFPRDVQYQYASENPAPGPDDPIDPEIPVALNPQNGSAFDTQLSYDVAGNLVQRTVDGSTFDLRYDGANRLRIRKGQQLDEEIYYYHEGARWLAVTRGKGRKLKKVRFWMDGTEIIYMCDRTGCARDETRTTVGVGGRDYLRVEEDSAGARETKLLHHNGLGHLLGVYSYDDSSGSLVYQLEVGFQYGPYGEILETGAAGGADPADYLQRFNGKELDLATGLSYYGHRYYDPVSLSWNRADPFFRHAPEAAVSDPRLGNLYSFSLNNPMRYVDPDGLAPFSEWEPPDRRCEGCVSGETIWIGEDQERIRAEEEARRLHWEMLRWFDSWQIESTDNRIWGGLRVLEGAGQAVVGGALCATVVGCFLGGGAMVLNGADIAGGGIATAVDGVRHKTAIETYLGPTAAKIQNWFALASNMGAVGVQILKVTSIRSAVGAGGGGGSSVRSVYSDGTRVLQGQQPPRIRGNDSSAQGAHSVLRRDCWRSRETAEI